MRISDWSSDVCSSDLPGVVPSLLARLHGCGKADRGGDADRDKQLFHLTGLLRSGCFRRALRCRPSFVLRGAQANASARSEEHTSELQSLMRISYAVFCLKKKKNTHNISSRHFSNQDATL